MQAEPPSDVTIHHLDFDIAGDGGIASNGKFSWTYSANDLQIFVLPSGKRIGKWLFKDQASEVQFLCSYNTNPNHFPSYKSNQIDNSQPF
jgi:hypothetical protein